MQNNSPKNSKNKPNNQEIFSEGGQPASNLLDFEPADVSDLYDKLSMHAWTLRALGILLKSSDLYEFASQYPEGEFNEENHRSINLRWGLNQIIELYLSQQKKILSEHLEQYHNSDPVLIKWAKTRIRDIEEGHYVLAPNRAPRDLRRAIEKLDIVIGRGGDLAGRAKELKGICFDHLDRLERSSNNNQDKLTENA